MHLSLILTELFSSLTGMVSSSFRIASNFVPGLSLAVAISSFLSSLFSTFNAILALLQILKHSRVIPRKLLLLHIGIVLLNILATASFLAQAILSVSPPPLSFIATLSFALLQFIYIAVSMTALKDKVEQKLIT
ncbi:hypothetical protein HAT2_00363 [Candidatus Similichlamydia laticola]|uniref:Uncharacterized protein n=1 Tax=Candidatus Similichlamydia laticola TaxID=2170265 RepID=A0A369KDM5_9BACT|nr:hypothetical protein HAT2_00363 [Candidatus Similichlamydia laticola]